MIKKSCLASLLTLAFVLGGGETPLQMSQAHAEVDIPCSSVRVIVPWSPGGDTDIIFRDVVEAANQAGADPELRVVNIAGESGNTGAREALNAEPDGCTLLALHESMITTYIMGAVDFTWEAFDPVSLLTFTPSVIGANVDTPYDNAEEWVQHAKDNPGDINVGATIGSTSQFVFLIVEEQTGAEFNYVPYEGTRERLTAILEGSVEVGEMNIITAQDYIADGDMKALGIALEERDPNAPDIPTLKEQGVDLVYGLNRGVVLPPGADPELVAYYEDLFEQAVKNPDVAQGLEERGTRVRYKDSQGYEDFFADAYETHERIAKEMDLYAAED